MNPAMKARHNGTIWQVWGNEIGQMQTILKKRQASWS